MNTSLRVGGETIDGFTETTINPLANQLIDQARAEGFVVQSGGRGLLVKLGGNSALITQQQPADDPRWVFDHVKNRLRRREENQASAQPIHLSSDPVSDIVEVLVQGPPSIEASEEEADIMADMTAAISGAMAEARPAGLKRGDPCGTVDDLAIAVLKRLEGVIPSRFGVTASLAPRDNRVLVFQLGEAATVS